MPSHRESRWHSNMCRVSLAPSHRKIGPFAVPSALLLPPGPDCKYHLFAENHQRKAPRKARRWSHEVRRNALAGLLVGLDQSGPMVSEALTQGPLLQGHLTKIQLPNLNQQPSPTNERRTAGLSRLSTTHPKLGVSSRLSGSIVRARCGRCAWPRHKLKARKGGWLTEVEPSSGHLRGLRTPSGREASKWTGWEAKLLVRNGVLQLHRCGIGVLAADGSHGTNGCSSARHVCNVQTILVHPRSLPARGRWAVGD
jgi:hypothetical protein